MPAIRPASEIAAKWARVTPGRTEDYKAGVLSPRKSWEEAAKAAEGAYGAGVTAAVGAKRFSKGVAKAGQAEWQGKASTKGADRYGPGVQMAEEDYSKGFAPYADVISRTVLPPRRAKGDPGNIERVRIMAAALRAAKVGK